MPTRAPKPPRKPTTYWLTRFMLLRLTGIVYAVAFLVAVNEIVPLLGQDGLTPMGWYMDNIHRQLGGSSFGQLPSIFWLSHSDAMLRGVAWTGFILACVVAAGWANAVMMTVLWVLYMSIVHLGGEWYGYGWEIQILETGFLGIFLCPLWDARPLPRRPPPTVIIWLYRWLIFRIMIGSALIKLRGSASWRDWTALYHHFETQPIPNALSRWFNAQPKIFLRLGVGFNYLAELVAPWFIFWPRLARHIAGVVIVAFQVVLILSGNLSFLNWLTIIPALACFDDSFWAKILPRALTRRAQAAAVSAKSSLPMQILAILLAVAVAVLSWPVVKNLCSNPQAMNTSYEPWDIVNTYGAFGFVGEERYNVVFEGTDVANPDSLTEWKPYLYKGLPVDLMRRPPQIAPYQLHLDWQMWFASMATYRQYPWTLNLVWKLLHNDPGTLSLFANNPFPDKPPRFVRARLYKYHFADAGNPTGAYWTREDIGDWLPPFSADDPQLQAILTNIGWLPARP